MSQGDFYTKLTTYDLNQGLRAQLSREMLLEKSTKVHAIRPTGGLGIHWDFVYWPGRNV